MRRLCVILMTSAFLPWSSVSATIINVPDEYPTIQAGINAGADGDTVLVQPETYYENIDFNGHNIVLGSLFLTTGDTLYISTTIIDGSESGSVVAFQNGEDSTAIITGFTIQNGHSMDGGGIHCFSSNPTICNNMINGNSAESDGGGIYCDDSDPVIVDNMISGNSNYDGAGGGIYCWNSSSPTISGNTVSGNSSPDGGGICCYLNSDPIISGNTIMFNSAAPGGHGGGIYCYDCNPTIRSNIIIGNVASSWLEGLGGGICCNAASPAIVNNTISQNLARYGGGIHCILVSNPTITNTILWADNAPYEPEIDFDDSSSPVFTYCDIQGGWPGEGNIDFLPLFRDPVDGDFHLMSVVCGDSSDSPCIDAGHPDILDILLDCNRGLGTVLSDIGAYGGGDSAQVGIDDKGLQIPGQVALSQNYPNPFNTITTICFSLPEPQEVTLTVCDLLGRKVKTLMNEYQLAGIHHITFNASDLASGIYFYRLQTGELVESRFMILLK